MCNIIKSEWFLLKRWIVALSFGLLTAYAAVFVGGLFDDVQAKLFTVQALDMGSAVGILIVALITALCIAGYYQLRIQIYEIMAGFSPNTIIFSRVAFYVPLLTVFFLIPVSIVMLVNDNSTEMLQTLALFWVLLIRFLLCTIFLSPLLKAGTWLVCMTAFPIQLKQAFDTPNELDNSVFGFLGAVQSSLLSEPITPEFTIKVIISSVVSCVICYLIGYYTLKRKIELEQKPIV